MGSCLYGSKKKDGAQDQFSITDTGGFCFALGLNSTICPLIDIIPSIVGVPWRQIIKTVGETAFVLLVNEATGQINTADFCSREPPPLPEDISYLDVFNWIASYTPIVGGFLLSDPLLTKISAYYLYTKWFEFCECKPLPNPKPKVNEPIPYLNPFIPDAPDGSPCSVSYYENAPRMNNLINDINQKNTSETIRANQAEALNTKYYFENILPTVQRLRQNGYVIEDGPDIIFDNPNYELVGIRGSFGCINYKIYRFGSQYTAKGLFKESPYNPFGYSLNSCYFDVKQLDNKYILVDVSQCGCPKIKLSDCQITCEKPPITPPKAFCDLFPDSPFCNKVPPKPCDIESVNVLVFNGCGKDRKSVSRTLFKSGDDITVSVLIFDGCGKDRKSVSRTLFNC